MVKVLQTPQEVNRVSNFFVVGNGQALACSGTSANVAFQSLPQNVQYATDILLYNAGTVNVFVAFGSDNTITASAPTNGTPANGIIIAPSAYLAFNKGYATYIAGIAASSTATLYFYQGYGS